MATEREVRPATATAEFVPAQPLNFDEVYEQCFPSIWRTLARLGVPQAQLDDIAQEVFLVIHRKLGQLRDPSKLKPWATSFAVRAASDVRRHLRRRGTPEEVSDDLPAVNRTDTQYDQKQSLEILQSVLAGMSDELREVFVLIELDEMTGPEVALSLSLNLNTVYSRLRLARAAFNTLIERLVEAP